MTSDFDLNMELTISELKRQNLILLDTVSGSRAYGLATATSDTDTRGVFIMSRDRYYGFDPIDQVSSERNDHSYFELGKYMKLLAKNNPVSIELLFASKDTIITRHPLMAVIKPEAVVSKLCLDTFAGYAHSQIKRAKGLNKKIFNPVALELPQAIDCCHVVEGDRTIPAERWLNERGMIPERCGLSALPHVRDGYALFYADDIGHNDHAFNGLFRTGAETTTVRPSHDVCLSSIPKGLQPRAWLVFNKDEYSRKLKDYHEYRQWEQSRNPERYQGTIAHGGGYDAKNMMHTFRLLRMAKEIAISGKPSLCRPDRDELLAIKSGQFSYDELLVKSSQELQEIEHSYAKSDLPDRPDVKQIERWAIDIRTAWYDTH